MSDSLRPAAAVDPWLLAAATLQVAAWIAVARMGRANHADPLWRWTTSRLRILLFVTSAAGILLAFFGMSSIGALVMGLVPGMLVVVVLFVVVRHLQQVLGDRISR